MLAQKRGWVYSRGVPNVEVIGTRAQSPVRRSTIYCHCRVTICLLIVSNRH